MCIYIYMKDVTDIHRPDVVHCFQARRNIYTYISYTVEYVFTAYGFFSGY